LAQPLSDASIYVVSLVQTGYSVDEMAWESVSKMHNLYFEIAEFATKWLGLVKIM